MKNDRYVGREHLEFVPQMAIIVYGSERFEKEKYLTYSPITIDKRRKDKYSFGEEIPLQEETLATVIGSISKEFIQHHNIVEIIPENLILNCQIPGLMNIIWYHIKPKKRLIFSKSYGHSPTKEITLPNIMFQWMDQSLFVYTFKGKQRPFPGMQLFKAPFPNISPKGLVCLGNAKPDMSTKSISEFINSVEKAFFESEFNHGGTGTTKSDFYKVWKDTYNTGIFPENELKESDYSLRMIMEYENSKG